MRVKVYVDVAHEWRWSLYGTDGDLLADCGEGYVRRIDCLYGLLLATGVDARWQRFKRSETEVWFDVEEGP